MPWSPDNKLSAREFEQFLDGDRKALGRFFDVYGPIVRYMVARRVRYRPDLAIECRDIENEVWERLLGNGRAAMRGYDPGRGTLVNYVCMKVFGMASKSFARHAGWRLASSPAPTEDSISVPSDGKALGDLDLLQKLFSLARLKTDDIRLLEELIVLGYPAAEVAQRHGMSVHNVYTRKRRLLARLRSPLAEELSAEDLGAVFAVVAAVFVALSRIAI